MTQPSHHPLAVASHTRLLVIDMQERLLPVIEDHAAVLRSTVFLVEAARLLNVPVDVSEQYPKGLGRTVPELQNVLQSQSDSEAACVPVEKMRFSAAGAIEPKLAASASQYFPISVAIAGIETHICVQQTALELLASGYRVSVIADAVGSRFSQDKQTALDLLRQAGVTVTSAESIVFEWCGSAEHPEFRSLSQLVRKRER
ncbi:MAG: isochorismatase family protein [Planctomycetaceae bacterium]